MRDLFRCLDEYPTELLEVISAVWEVSLPDGEPREMAHHLAKSMLAPNALEGVLRGLTAGAGDALAEMVREGGVVPGHRLYVQYGAMRRLGPARMAREQPWARPESVLEELYYKGIIYRAYATVDDYYGEVYFVPRQFLKQLQNLQDQSSELSIEQVPTPESIEHDGDALVEDLLAFLVRVRQGQICASGREKTSTASQTLDDIDLGPRLLGENHPDRLDLVRRLLWRLGLLEAQEGVLRPSPRARKWLRLPDGHRAQSVYLAWRDDPHRDELGRLRSLHIKDLGGPINPTTGRRALLSVLNRCPAGPWLGLDSFVETLKRHRPDYLRPDGDYDSWRILDASTGESLSGFASWDRIEGALARHIITAPLRWLGIVDVGYSEGGAAAFRLVEREWSLLADALEPPPSRDFEASSTPATVSDDFLVSIPVKSTMYERYQLERFAEWAADLHLRQAQDATATYRISEDSVWRGVSAGIKTAQMAKFLDRITHGQVAPAVLRSLRAWGGRFGRTTLRRTLLLRTPNQDTMRRIRAHPGVRNLLGETLSPTMCLVDQENEEDLIAQLKDLGIWPLLRG